MPRISRSTRIKARFGWLVLAGCILMMIPHDAATRLQIAIVEAIRVPVQSGRWIGLSARTSIATGGYVPAKEHAALADEHRRLLNRHRTLEATLEQTYARLDELAGIKQIRPLGKSGVLAARIVAQINTGQILIAAGASDGVAAGSFVLLDNAIIGRVGQAGKHTSKVDLVTSPGCVLRVAASPSRVAGLLRGSGDGTMAIRTKAPCPTKVGETVLVEEPPVPGWPVGTVMASGLDQQDPLLWRLDVRPDFDIDRSDVVWVVIAAK